MKNWQNRTMSKVTCWTVFFALVLSFVFSAGGLDFGHHVLRIGGRSDCLKWCQADVSVVIDCAETEVPEEGRGKVGLEDLLFSYLYCPVFDFSAPLCSYQTASDLLVANHSPKDCPLRI